MKRQMILTIGLACCVTIAHAGKTFAEAGPAEAGAATRGWLALQKNPQAQSATPPQVSGEVADKTWSRYLKSYEQPVPAEFDRDQFVTGSGGGR